MCCPSKAGELYDKAREAVRKFINAKHFEEVIFVRNSTEGLNLIARSYGETHLKKGDKVVIPISEHHSNLVPWQRACRKTGAELVYMYLDETGHFTEEDLAKIDERTKIVSFAAVSNVLGMVRPVKEVVERAHKVGAIAIVDGAQSTPHMKTDVQDLDCGLLRFFRPQDAGFHRHRGGVREKGPAGRNGTLPAGRGYDRICPGTDHQLQ